MLQILGRNLSRKAQKKRTSLNRTRLRSLQIKKGPREPGRVCDAFYKTLDREGVAKRFRCLVFGSLTVNTEACLTWRFLLSNVQTDIRYKAEPAYKVQHDATIRTNVDVKSCVWWGRLYRNDAVTLRNAAFRFRQMLNNWTLRPTQKHLKSHYKALRRCP